MSSALRPVVRQPDSRSDLQMLPGTSEFNSQRRLFWSLRCAALGFAILRAWIGRYWMNADGICYLDMADAWLAGDWSQALNSYWSPLYSWMLAAAMGAVNPGPAWEFPLLHAVNVCIFLIAMAAFEFYLRGLLSLQKTVRPTADNTPLPATAIILACYAFFAWTTLELVTVTQANPDLLTVAASFAAMGLIIRIRLNRRSVAIYAALGCVLGLGFLGKAVMLPLTPFFLVAAALAGGRWRGLLVRQLVAFATFALVSGGYIAALSAHYDRPTFGDAGRLAYLVMVNGVNKVHWQGDDVHGTPLHPSRIVHENPTVYEFGEPRGGTYPAWYDPGYWYEGAQPKFSLREQLAATKDVLRKYARLFLFENSAFLASVLILTFTGVLCGAGTIRRQLSRFTGTLWHSAYLAIPSLTALALYAAVYVDARYVGGFIALVCCWLIHGLVVQSECVPGLRRLGAAVAVVLWGFIAVGTARDAGDSTDYAAHLTIAQGVEQAGLRPGDRIGHIGYTFDAFWARLARLRVVAEVRPNEMDVFQQGDADLKRRVIDAFKSTGAKAVVTYGSTSPGSEWQRIPGTNHYVLVNERMAHRPSGDSRLVRQ